MAGSKVLFFHNSLFSPIKESLAVKPSRSIKFSRLLSSLPFIKNNLAIRFHSSSSSSSWTLAATSSSTDLLTTQEKSRNLYKWAEFASRVSGEWDGFLAEFTSDGELVELPESVVPEAYGEWGVRVFDWQTQCPTLASEDENGKPRLFYKLIKLLPTVGCEADAATRHCVEERVVELGRPENRDIVFGYDLSGSFVALWAIEGHGGGGEGDRMLEIEHCLVAPSNREERVRVVQVIRKAEKTMRLERIQVFSEHWFGPFRNGEQLGGCAIAENGIATARRVDTSEVVGHWKSTRRAVVRFKSEEMGDIFYELEEDEPEGSIQDQGDLIALPKQLWCSLKLGKDSKTIAEVGWLADGGSAITSKCIFQDDGRLKEMVIALELKSGKGL